MVAVPVTIDEVSTSGVLKQSIPLPTNQSGPQLACTLTGDTFAHEGFISVAADGSFAMFGCYNATPGSLTYRSNAARVIARIFPNGTVDTSMYMTDQNFPNVFVSVVAMSLTSGYWISTAVYVTNNPTLGGSATATPAAPIATTGVRYLAPGATTSAEVYNVFPVRALSLWNGQLFVAVGFAYAFARWTHHSLTAGQNYVQKPWIGSGGDADYEWGQLGAPGFPIPTSAATSVAFQTYEVDWPYCVCQGTYVNPSLWFGVDCGYLNDLNVWSIGA
jgi:hypothetical protein